MMVTVSQASATRRTTKRTNVMGDSGAMIRDRTAAKNVTLAVISLAMISFLSDTIVWGSPRPS